MNRRWLAILAFLWSSVCYAKVYRCDDAGRLHFSDKPCLAGQEPIEVASPNTMETSAGDQALARDYDRGISERRKDRSRKAVAKSDTAPVGSRADEKKVRKPKSRSTTRVRATPIARAKDAAPAYIVKPGAKPQK